MAGALLPYILCISIIALPAFSGGLKTKSSLGGSAAVKVDKKVNDTLKVVARLTEIAGKFPPNDLYDYVYIMKYRIITVESGNIRGKEILVGHYNPCIPRKQITGKMDPFVNGTVTSFIQGDMHRLMLITPVEKVWQNAIEDEYYDDDATRWYALRCDIVE